jgi:predicted CopG family antitoxin
MDFDAIYSDTIIALPIELSTLLNNYTPCIVLHNNYIQNLNHYKMEETTIQIKKITREKLKKIGRKGQSYDDIIENLLEIGKKVMFFDELNKIVDNEEFVPLDKL